MKKYDLSRIMKRAWSLVKTAGFTISDGLRAAWKEAKEVAEKIKNVVIEHFESYNKRRYGTPWVCVMTETGKYDFSKNVGTYTGIEGDDGDLVVFEPVIGQVYGWGQKDYRGGNTIKKFAKWTGSEFMECDKLGNKK